MCEIVIAHRKPKNAPHTRTSQVSTKWVHTRTSQLATCDRTSQVMPCFFFINRYSEVKKPFGLQQILYLLLLNLDILFYSYLILMAQGYTSGLGEQLRKCQAINW